MYSIIEKCNEIKKLENMSKEFMSSVKRHCFITGSYKFSSYSENSDIDIVIKPNHEVNFDYAITNGCVYLHNEPYFQDEFRSCYGLYNNKLFNFLFMHKIEFHKKWEYATNKMIQLINEEPAEKEKIKEKEYRVRLFETFKREFEALST